MDGYKKGRRKKEKTEQERVNKQEKEGVWRVKKGCRGKGEERKRKKV